MTNVNRYLSRHRASSQSGWNAGISHNIGGANLRQRSFTNLSPGTSYDIEVRSCYNQGFNHCGTPATLQVTTPPATDADGLIEVVNLAQLNAIHWDLDGDGSSTNSGYATAFPNAIAADTDAGIGNMGCPAAGCTGYELTANLDFDENGDGQITSTDATYWNDGAGWATIGDAFHGYYAAAFDGNGHIISHLFINRTNTNRLVCFRKNGRSGSRQAKAR